MSEKEFVLLIGRQNDPHIKGIQAELEKINQKYFLVDSLTLNDSIIVSNRKGDFDGIIKVNNSVIKMRTIKSVWNSNALQITNDANLLEQTRDFVNKEWTEGIMSVWNTADTVWVNHPLSISHVGNRIRQLQIASKIGLKTPKTLVTNNFQEMKEFFDECDGNVISKTLASSQGLPDGKMIYTRKLSEDDLEHADELKYAPCMFQEYIPKKTEFRVTVIGDKVHSAEIFSQKSSKTKHDWRNYDEFSKTPYVEGELPSEVSSKLLGIMKEFKLHFGACDLIRTPEDKFVFLEINPNGRWWWIQELTKMTIAKDVAKFLSLS